MYMFWIPTLQVFAVNGFDDVNITGTSIPNTMSAVMHCGEEYERTCNLEISPPFECDECQNTLSPSADPTETPTANPSYSPNMEPSEEPTANPTDDPTINPTDYPTINPTDYPSVNPSHYTTESPMIGTTFFIDIDTNIE